jgi:mycothiol synthase
VTRPLLTEGPLSPARAALVAELAEAARQADGVAPLSEHALLHVRYPSGGGSAVKEGSASGGGSAVKEGSAAGGSPDEPAARDLLLIIDETAVGYAHLDPPEDKDANEGDLSGELVVHPAYRRRGHASTLIAVLADTVPADTVPADTVLADTVLADSALASSASGRGIRLWAHGDLPAAAGLARATGFTRARSLWQMRRPLARAGTPAFSPGIPAPSFPAGVTLRTFIPGKDEEAWLELNARAFAHHPEQGAWTRADLELREAEPWFDPAGFFLAERDGQLAGFHWTKVHPEGPDGGPEGEVYVVGVDPGRQGGGLGRALTLAGLHYLADRGLAHVMLYVDEENSAATRLYTALGFTRSSTDVMYRRA